MRLIAENRRSTQATGRERERIICTDNEVEGLHSQAENIP